MEKFIPLKAMVFYRDGSSISQEKIDEMLDSYHKEFPNEDIYTAYVMIERNESGQNTPRPITILLKDKLAHSNWSKNNLA